MTTLLLEDLVDDAMDMVLRLAAADPRGFLHRVARHADVIVRRCSWCTWLIGFKPALGQAGVTDGICGGCQRTYRVAGFRVGMPATTARHQ